MNFSDFNMYYNSTYVRLKSGAMAYIECSDDAIYVNSYDSADQTNAHSERFLVDGDEQEESIQPVLDLISGERLELKPFVNDGHLYSPSIKSLRYYKTGLDRNNVDLRSIASGLNTGSTCWAKAMFFTKEESIADGIKAILSGERKYSILEDGFVLTIPQNDETASVDYSQFLPTPDDCDVELNLHDKTIHVHHKPTGLSTDLKTTKFNLSALTDWSGVFKKDNVCIHGAEYVPIPVDFPVFMFDCAKAAYEKSTQSSDVPYLELYRHGVLVCSNILELDEKTVKILRGLPRLTTLMENISNEFRKQSTDRS